MEYPCSDSDRMRLVLRHPDKGVMGKFKSTVRQTLTIVRWVKPMSSSKVRSLLLEVANLVSCALRVSSTFFLAG